MKYHQRHRKTTFKPLVPSFPDQSDPFPQVKKIKSLRKRRVIPTPTRSQTEDYVVSPGPSNRQKSRPILPEGKKVKTQNDGRTNSLISVESRLADQGSLDPTEDDRKYNTRSPVDPYLFNPQLVLGDDSSDEQSQI
jgi:hypothetical protein